MTRARDPGRTPSVRLLLAAACVALACGCSQREAPVHAAPAQARAALVLEPPLVAVGDVADVVLTVVTHPGTRIEPVEPPKQIPGFWWVEREAEEVAQEPERWVHRTRLRIRAVEIGKFEFPGGLVRGENAEGARLEIAYAPLPLEVVSTLGPEPAQRVPFGLRHLPRARVGTLGAALAFAAGALVALGAVGVVVLVRRRPPPRESGPSEPPGPPPWETARARFADAAAHLASDPRAALDAAARALRAYASERYGADATARTWEELSAATPPFLMTTRWTRFVALLHDLDAARFPAPMTGAPTAASLLEAARAFVEETVPHEARA